MYLGREILSFQSILEFHGNRVLDRTWVTDCPAFLRQYGKIMLQIQRFPLTVKEPFMTSNQRSGNPDLDVFGICLQGRVFSGIAMD